MAVRVRLSADARRAGIIDAARSIFADRGFQRTSTADIAAAAGCSEPTLYKHFASKQALFAAVLEDAGEQMRERFDSLLDEHIEDPLAVYEQKSRELVGDAFHAEVMRLRTQALALVDVPEIHEAVVHVITRHHRRAADVVRRSQELGTARTDIDPDAAAWLSVGLSLVAGVRRAIEGPDALADMPSCAHTLVRLVRSTPDPDAGVPA